jgi:hypothetical protein
VLVLTAAVFMALIGLWRLSTALPFLMWVAELPHPTDLHARFHETSGWFAGIFERPVGGRADYPPASYIVLWPLLGWLTLEHARVLWGVTSVAALSLLSYMAAKEGGARTRTQQALLMLLPFSGYATAATLSVGQVGNHVVPALVAGVLLLHSSRGRWWQDVSGAVLLLFALVKPILSAPFFWIVCFAMGRLRPAVLTAAGYIGFTLFAASFQDGDLLTILTGWLGEGVNWPRGTVNLHKWLYQLGLASWVLPATLVTLLAFGGWVYRHRRTDIWILMGVAALVSRLGFHHRVYDDVLLAIPLIALFRLAAAGRVVGDRDVIAGILFALIWATVNAPAQLFFLPPPVPALMQAGQALVWIAALGFLLDSARHDNHATPIDTSPDAVAAPQPHR